MKRLLLLLTLTFAGISCEKTPEPESGQDTAVTDTELLAVRLNRNIKALGTIAYEYCSGHGIKVCLPDKTGEVYAILFTDGQSVAIRTSAAVTGDGTAEGIPVVGIRNENEMLVWTIDGRSTGKSASAEAEVPTFSAVEEKLSFRFGELSETYDATDVTVASFFMDVIQEEEGCTILFSDGGSLHFSKASVEDSPQISQSAEPRRPVSPEQPMWIIHIDTWLHPDPQKIIDLIPADIIPFAVFNLSLSAEGGNEGRWTKVEYGYETAKTWLRTCAMNKVWAMIQPASGAYSHFKDTETYDEISESVYAEFFREYPNFIGFNYCEQFWGFDEEYSVTYEQRLRHWSNLMRLCHEYGGYLIVSCCGPYYAASMNPAAMVKRGGEFTEMCREYPENLIICEKFTSKYGFYNTESACLGMWLSGFAGHYGIRFDTCGWNGTEDNPACPLGAGISAQLEHIMLTGETVIDGPELIREECYAETSETRTADGYTSRTWELFPQFENISMDLFRKIIEGSIRIPQKKEVIDRTRVILINDINAGSDQERYTAPAGLYQGLYQMDDDGDMLDNRTWFKKTGRYPSIPYAAELNGTDAMTFQKVINMSSYASTWQDPAVKKEEMDLLFPEEYTGDIFAASIGDSWVVYNPYKEIGRAEGELVPKYNTCDRIRVSLPNFSAAVLKESSDRISVYLNNYDPSASTLQTDTLQIHGVTDTPSVTLSDRGSHAASMMESGIEDGIYTISVSHNGPVDLEITCSGRNSRDVSSAAVAGITAPQGPEGYEGELQFEAESFDYKNIASIIRNGSSKELRNYTGQGYMDFGQKTGASARIGFSQDRMTSCAIGIKYTAPEADIDGLAIEINGRTTAEVTLSRTKEGEWNVFSHFIELNSGRNTITLTAKKESKGACLIDNITLTPISSGL